MTDAKTESVSLASTISTPAPAAPQIQVVLSTDLESKINQIVSSLSSSYGAQGQLTTDTIIQAVTNAMLAAKEMTMLDGSTRETVVLTALKTFVTNHKNLATATQAQLLVFIDTFGKPLIDNIIWQGQQAIDYSTKSGKKCFCC